MSFTSKNWKLLILAFCFIVLFISLGFWQLSRARQKEKLLTTFELRTKAKPQSAASLNLSSDMRFFRAQLSGRFDNAHTFLLDNKILDGKVGYEVYTPFYAQGLSSPILIDRGFISMGNDRHTLPIINQVVGETSITGLLNLPPTYVAFGQIQESSTRTWPLRIEYVNLQELNKILDYSLFNYLLLLEPNQPASFDVKWQIVTVQPERHRGYALQWFAFALTLAVISVALNRKSARDDL